MMSAGRAHWGHVPVLLLLAAWGGHGIGAPAKEGEPEPKAPAFHAGLASACEAAAADGALVLAVFTTETCGACRKLKRETLQSQEFLKPREPLHVAVIDADADARAARAFNVGAVPDLVLLTSDRKIVARRRGFVSPEELLRWLEEGRQRAAAGLWLGSAPRGELDPLRQRARSGKLTEGDFRHLVGLLGDRDPATRSRALSILISQRERAMPFLLGGVGHEHLAVRITVGEALKKLAPNAPAANPWASKAERQEHAAALKAWWSREGKLPPASAAPAAGRIEGRAIRRALSAVASGDPVTRTEGMTTLTRIGSRALPNVREAIQRCARRGDQRSLWALEDVRWAILIPDAVEASAKGTRRALARGTSRERQAAAANLSAGGRDALPALRELAADPDPLVQEGAIRALTGIGGAEAVLRIAGLLDAPDSNLRMLAAQALGNTKDPRAAKHLVAVLSDPDEVVACTAIAALEEVKAVHQRDALARCLRDPRWRVRAAAAEAIGKLKITDATKELNALLNDDDAFVIKNALDALRKTGGSPTTKQLESLVKRAPVLTGLATEILVAKGTPAALELVTRLFDQADDAGRAGILEAAARSSSDSSDKHWKPLLSKAAASANPHIRRLAATALAERSERLRAELITPLLADEEEQVRRAAAAVVLDIAAVHWGVTWSGSAPDHGILRMTATAAPAVASGGKDRHGRTAAQRLARVKKLREQHAAWRAALLRRAGSRPPPVVALTIYVLGDGKADLPLLMGMLDHPELKARLGHLSDRTSVGLLLRRLAWPEGKQALEKGCRLPFFHAMALSQRRYASKPVAKFLSAPERILATLRAADKDVARSIISPLIGSGRESDLSLLTPSEQNAALLKALLNAKEPALRCLGIYARGARGDQDSAAAGRALKEKDPWIRRAALQGVVRAAAGREQSEARIARFLSDPHDDVVEVAVLGLLSPEVRQAAGLASQLAQFKHGRIEVWASGSNGSEGRPLMALSRKPEFLPQIRRLLAKRSGDDDMVPALILVLAQFGDFSGLDVLAERSAAQGSLPDAMAAGIALSNDPKYLPLLYSRLRSQASTWQVNELLGAVRSMRGTEARDFRRAANRRLRELAAGRE